MNATEKTFEITCRLKAEHGAARVTFMVEATSYRKAVAALLAQHPEVNSLTCALARKS